MKQFRLLLLLLLTAGVAHAWDGDTDKFIINGEIIKLNAPAEAGDAFLSDTSSVVFDAYWSCTFLFDYLPSSSNYAKYYLMSDSPYLNESLNGYFIRIGHTNKNIALCRQRADEISVVAQGEKNTIEAGVPYTISAIRTEKGEWEIYSRIESEQDSVLQAVAEDVTFDYSTHCGVSFKYTSTRSRAFSFWDFKKRGMKIEFSTHDAGNVWLGSDIFTPDANTNQLAYIQYKMESAAVVNLYIYSTNGALVSRLVKNRVLPVQGVVTWDGVSDRGIKMPPGIYVILFEAFTDERVILRKKVPFTISVK